MKDKPEEIQQKLRRQNLRAFCRIIGGCDFHQINPHNLVSLRNALQDLQGRAQLDISLRTRQVMQVENATLALELTNTGRSPA